METALSRERPSRVAPAARDQDRAASTAAGERIYAIGDIHGCYSLLLRLLGQIEDHAGSLPPGPPVRIILLGDLIDRGPASAKVLRLAYELQRLNDNFVVLLGNHEAMMLDAVANRRGALGAWLRFGGEATLRAFGIDPPRSSFTSREYATALQSAIPGEWLEWLRQLPVSFRSGDYFFCHAGIRPGVAIKRQSREDLLWIREEFLRDEGDHGVVVVHGHSITPRPEVRSNRIGIDTGAYHSGVLSAVYLEGDRCEIIATEKSPSSTPLRVAALAASDRQ